MTLGHQSNRRRVFVELVVPHLLRIVERDNTRQHNETRSRHESLDRQIIFYRDDEDGGGLQFAIEIPIGLVASHPSIDSQGAASSSTTTALSTVLNAMTTISMVHLL